MRRSIILSLLGAALSSGGSAALSATKALPHHPMRVMSMNQCTDQIVLALLPPKRVASVTWLSRDPQGSLMVAAAGRVDVNHGLAEEVVRQRPDLIITSTLASAATRGLLRRMGWPMIEVPDSATFDQIRAATRQIAAAVDERILGEALIAAMDRKLADLARHPAPPIRVAAWDGGGFSAQRGSLYDTVLRTAGAINVANTPPATGYGRPDTEALLATAPQLLIQGGYDQAGMRANIAHHPLVRRFWGEDRTLVIRQAYYLCGTPFIADAALMLRQQLRAATKAARAPLPFGA